MSRGRPRGASYGYRTNKAPRDGRCTKWLMTGGGRCPNDVVDGGILCAGCLANHKGWGSRLRVKIRRNDEGEVLPYVQPPLPAWMQDPSLLPKKPPGVK